MCEETTKRIKIIGTGSYAPERVLTNEDLTQIVDTSDEWITSRTGIKERHIVAPGEATSDMGAAAAKKAIEDAGIDPSEIDLIFVGTASPDMPFPSASCLIQDKIGAKNAFCVDLNAACSGFIYALDTARHYLAGSGKKTGLVIGAETITNFVDWEDRTTCVLFGDGAGAVLIRAEEGEGGIQDAILGSDGSLNELLMIPAGGSRKPITKDTVGDNDANIKMAGREVFKHAVTNMSAAATEVLERNGLTTDDVALVIPHQANARIVGAIAQKLDLSEDRMFMNVQKYGNTSAASIGLAMDEAAREGRLQPGDKVMLVAFGGGFTWGAMLLEWTKG